MNISYAHGYNFLFCRVEIDTISTTGVSNGIFLEKKAFLFPIFFRAPYNRNVVLTGLDENEKCFE